MIQSLQIYQAVHAPHNLKRNKRLVTQCEWIAAAILPVYRRLNKLGLFRRSTEVLVIRVHAQYASLFEIKLYSAPVEP